MGRIFLCGLVTMAAALSTAPAARADAACIARAAAAMQDCSARARGSGGRPAPGSVAACGTVYQTDLAACAAADRDQRAALAKAQADRLHDVQVAREEIQGLEKELAGYVTAGWPEGATDAGLDGAVPALLKDVARLKVVAGDLSRALASDAALANAIQPPVLPAERKTIDDDAAFSDERASQLADATQALVNKEKACRSDKKCMAARAAKKAEEQFFATVVSPMCQADQMREGAQADIARERANPSGYVDAVRLHDDGEALQSAQEQLKALAPAYAKFRKHAWPGWRRECRPAAPPP